MWGGARLRPKVVPTAEAWVVYEKDLVANGPLAGQTLDSLAGQDPAGLLGRRPLQNSGARFPLLIKLLDCAQWLSLQVHPDNALAEAIEGLGFFGKTEAWHILEAEPDARIIAGMRPGVQPTELEAALGKKVLLDLVQYHTVHAGETVFMPARTIHALGPGLLVYEVQQTSDLTYRVYDWDRPQTGGRVLHVEKARLTADSAARCQLIPPSTTTGMARLCQSSFFNLDLLIMNDLMTNLDTAGETFHALTVIEGSVHLQWRDFHLDLPRFASALIPAVCGAYSLNSPQNSRLLLASL